MFKAQENMASSLQKAWPQKAGLLVSHQEQMLTYVAVDGRCGSLPEHPQPLLVRDARGRAQHPAVRHCLPSRRSIVLHRSLTLDLQPRFRQIQGKCH